MFKFLFFKKRKITSNISVKAVYKPIEICSKDLCPHIWIFRKMIKKVMPNYQNH